MDKKELQKAQNIIDALFYDDKALTQWQHTLLENVISIAQTKLRQPDVKVRREQLICDYCGNDKEEELDHCKCYRGTAWVKKAN